MKNIIKYLVAAIFGIIVFSFASYYLGGDKLGGINPLTGTFTNSSANASSTSVGALINANTGRNYLYMCNDGSNTAYLHFTSTTTNVAAAKGIRIAAAGCYTIDQSNLYLGAIYGITSSGTTTLSYIEK